MNIQGSVFHHLYAGHVICEISEPRFYKYLMEEDGLEAIEAQIDPLGMDIAVTTGGRAFYLVRKSGTPESRRAISGQARPLQEEFARVKSFADFILQITDADGVLKMGSVVSATQISKAIEHSASLREALITVSSSLATKGATDHAKITAILSKMKDMGYLRRISSEREEYDVTGRIDLFHDAIEHFLSHIGSVNLAVEVSDKQGSLL